MGGNHTMYSISFNNNTRNLLLLYLFIDKGIKTLEGEMPFHISQLVNCRPGISS